MTNSKPPLIDVVLHVWGDELNPTDISSYLGIEPSRSRRKGQKRATVEHRETTAQTGIWNLFTSNSEDLSTRIQELSNMVGNRARRLHEIAGVQGAYVDIYIAVMAEEGGGGQHNFALSAKDVELLQQMGLPIEFTLDTVNE